MKREIIASALLILIFVGTVINININDRMLSELEAQVKSAYESAENGDFDRAQAQLKSASEHWLSLDSYTHVFIRHSEIDALTDAFFEFEASLCEEEASCKGEYDKLMAHLESIRTMEHLSFGSIL